MLKPTLLLLIYSSSLLAFIHGDDDRKDLSQISERQVIEWARASATMISESKINHFEGDTAVFWGRPLDFFHKNLCPSVPFQKQPSVSHCSGILVAPNMLLTAGHCIYSKFSSGPVKCPTRPWVFGYDDSSLGEFITLYDQEYDYEESFVEIRIPKKNIYHCQEVMAFDYTPDNPDRTYRDFALLKLDRDVTGRTPVPVSEARVMTDDQVIAIGNSLGLPVKISDNATVYNDNLDTLFTSTLDVFQNNSGGGVIDPNSGKVVGIVVKGIRDFIMDSSQGCYKSYQAFPGEALAKIQRIPPQVTDILRN